jgi:hypothetical protein
MYIKSGARRTRRNVQTRRESRYLNVARLAEAALTVSFVWMLRGRRLAEPDFPLLVCAGLLLPLAPGLYFLIRIPRDKEWMYISLIHQAFAIVSGALALIFLLSTFIPSAAPISETWPVIVFCSGTAGMQLLVAFVARYFLRNATFKANSWKTVLVRTAMVLYFAVLFLLLK